MYTKTKHDMNQKKAVQLYPDLSPLHHSQQAASRHEEGQVQLSLILLAESPQGPSPHSSFHRRFLGQAMAKPADTVHSDTAPGSHESPVSRTVQSVWVKSDTDKVQSDSEDERGGRSQSDEHGNCFKGNVGEVSERRGGARIGFFERINTVYN